MGPLIALVSVTDYNTFSEPLVSYELLYISVFSISFGMN